MDQPASNLLSRLLCLGSAKSPLGAAVRMAWLAVILVLPCAVVAERFAAGAGFVAALLFSLLALVVVFQMTRHYSHTRLGLCNAVTLLRVALVVALAAPLFAFDAPTDTTSWTIAAVAAVALVLDGVDGWSARRSALSSAFGARFDMEVDAALGLTLAVLVIDLDKVGPWVIALGALRYAFVAASWVLPWLTVPLPDRFSRKVVCVVQIGALIALTAPPVTGIWAVTVGMAATLALAWSFAVDIVYLYRRRQA